MDKPLVVQVQEQRSCCQSCLFEFVLTLKVLSLVVFTYGLMVLMFEISIQIELCQGSYSQSYQAGGGILLALFVAMWIFWGGLWCWGAQRRELLRREIVEKQLELIRAQEKFQEDRDLQEERHMIEQKRRKDGR